MAILFNPYQQYLDNLGIPVANGTLTFWLNKTTTKTTLYSDVGRTVAQSNPYTLDASGRSINDVFFSGTVSVQLSDKNGAEIRVYDDVNPEGDQVGPIAVLNNAALKAADTSLVTAAHVHGTTTANDGGGGYYYYDSGSSATDDGDTVLEPDVGTGRWLLFVRTSIAPKQFATVAAMTADVLIAVGDLVLVRDYAAIDSGILYFLATSGAAPAPDAGAQIDHDTLSLYFAQIFPVRKNNKQYGIGGGSDQSTELLAFIANATDGDELDFTNTTIITTSTIALTTSLSFFMVPARRDFDNSFDTGSGGTVIWQKSLTANGMTITAPASASKRITNNIRGGILRGPRVSPGSSSAGDGLVIDGGTDPATSVYFDIENFHICEFFGVGLRLKDLTYGNYIKNIAISDCGQTGMVMQDDGASAVGGEDEFHQIRIFGCGKNAGSTVRQLDGFDFSPGGSSVSIGLLTSSENARYGGTLRNGTFNIQNLHMESNSGSQYLVVGSADGAGDLVNSCKIGTFIASFGSNYTGQVIAVHPNVESTIIGSAVLSGSLSGGYHLQLESGTSDVIFENLVTESTLAINDLGAVRCWMNNNYVIAAGNNAETNVTGNGTAYTLLYVESSDPRAQYASGIFTVKMPGRYRIEASRTMENLTALHTECSMTISTTVAGDTEIFYNGNIGAMRDANNRFTASGHATVELSGGDTVKIVLAVDGGGSDDVDLVGDARFGKLTIENVR